MKTAARLIIIAAVGVLLATQAAAQLEQCPCSSTICSQQGFAITLNNFSIDQNGGTSSWDYQVCHDPANCGPTPKDLSHVDIVLPGIGECLTASQSITLVQIGGFGNATLACGVSDKEPSCDLCKPGTGVPGVPCQPPDNPAVKVAKCDVAGGTNLDPGECVTMRLTIAGETPTLGVGAADVVTKAGPTCTTDCILGPACVTCQPPPPERCLTRTAGFWGTHPHITNQFLAVTVCGKTLNTTAAGSCYSVTEGLCAPPGSGAKGDQAYVQLVRQLAAAKLNLAATAANGGACGNGIAARIAQCEALFCNANQATISGSGCIEDLNAFNNSLDSLGVTPPPFDRPGPANPSQCQVASSNNMIIGKGVCK